MCVRFIPSAAEEAQAVLDARGTGRHGIRFVEHPDSIHDAHPGSTVSLFVPDGAGSLKVARLEWGGVPARRKAPRRLQHPHRVSARAAPAWPSRHVGQGHRRGRCLVPARAFCESHATERVPSERTGKPVRRQYRFRLPGARAFLLAAIQQDGRFSIVTTEPNTSVAPIHDRMPLVLGPSESSIWLDLDFASLADCALIGLLSEPAI